MFPNKECRCSKGIQALVDMKNKGVMPSSLPDYGHIHELVHQQEGSFLYTGPWEYAN